MARTRQRSRSPRGYSPSYNRRVLVPRCPSACESSSTDPPSASSNSTIPQPPCPPFPSHVPAGVASWLAEVSGQPTCTLARLTVQESNDLYESILDYVYLCSDVSSVPTAVHVAAVDDHPHRSRPLDTGDRAWNIADEEDFNHGTHKHTENRSEDDAKVQRTLQRLDRMRNIGTPRFEMGVGQAIVPWPPLPHLSAAALNRVERHHVQQLDRKATEEEAGNDNMRDVANSKGPQESEKTVPSSHHNHRDDETRLEIYVSHHTLDTDWKRRNGWHTHKEVMLLCKGRVEQLETFAEEVLAWNELRRYLSNGGAAPDGDGLGAGSEPEDFTVYRLKMDQDGGFWENDGTKRCRPAKSVILADNKMGSIMDEVRQFLNGTTRAWYLEHGLPLRRSLLFHGSPGTGKTSAIRAIASEFGLSVCLLGLTGSKFSNQTLADALSSMPDRALLVLEDVDALFDGREAKGGDGLTFSGLLNSLDGIVSVDGLVTIMTTNHVDRLDQALLRGGRVDRRFYFNPPTDQQIVDFFASFYPTAPDDTKQRFLLEVRDRPPHENARSMASLQQLFISMHQKSADECVQQVDSFFSSFIPMDN